MNFQQPQQAHQNGGNSQQQQSALAPPTRLSDILPPSTAVSLLGPQTTRTIIRSFLRCGCSPLPTTPPQPIIVGGNVANSNVKLVGPKEKSVRWRHTLDEKESLEEKEEIDLLLLGLSFDFLLIVV